MKKLLILLTVLFSINSFSQETTYKEYSYSQLFKMIEAEKDSVFTLENAIIRFDIKTDSIYAGIQNLNTLKIDYFRKETIIVYKQLVFKNVQFLPFDIIQKGENEIPDIYTLSFNNILFKKEVKLENSIAFTFSNSIFEEYVSFTIDTNLEKIYDYFEKVLFTENDGFFIHVSYSDMLFENVKFQKGAKINYNQYFSNKNLENITLKINNCIFKPSPNITLEELIFIRNLGLFEITSSKFNSKNQFIYSLTNNFFLLEGSTFNEKINLSFSTKNTLRSLSINNNTFLKDILLNVGELNDNSEIDWKQWQDKVISEKSLYEFRAKLREHKKYKDVNPIKLYEITQSDSVYDVFKNEYHLHEKKSLKEEYKLRTKFIQFYRKQYENDNANLVYIEYKDIETKTSQINYQEIPNFENFFNWKINQFLKVFSAYGTKPAKAVVFSMYVILLFAFVYLLFPNSWDAHGRKRIMNRYAFFFTYMNKKAGIHEVYLDNQKEDLLEFDEFKTLVEQQGKTVPKFFTATALPLYKWAISGTKFSASVLRRFDIMKGTWSELPKSKRVWKSVLLIGAFLIAICYDILIKMLNALMLSINTFTTLGFGEIPMKGLPRYLAIIQGFIGWFMLTIFSVSLISQLLN